MGLGGEGGVAPWVKYSLFRHEDLNSDAQHQQRKQAWGHMSATIALGDGTWAEPRHCPASPSMQSQMVSFKHQK